MAQKSVTRESIQKGFQDYLLNEAKIPQTVRILTNYLKITEASFFEHYGSLAKVEASIWEDYYGKTLTVLQKDADFVEMNEREKHLSFLFTLLEVIKEDRSYIQYRLLHKASSMLPLFILKTARVIDDADIEWASPPRFIPEKGHDLVKSGYRKVLWKHSLATIHFWIKDDSPGAEDTDAFIEKSTRTLFDLGQLPALDSVIDLGKFFLQKIGFSKAATS
ncbi:MAG: hypothetical protein RIM99_18470 [Cyclobacteriaceae bacterium]